MRHARAGKKLGRDASHRKALYSNLSGALITHGRIETTEAKAKAVRPVAEKLVTLGKRGDLHARRQAMAELRSNDVVHRLFSEVAPRFAERPGGYTRIVKLGPRQGDAAPMAYLEFVDYSTSSESWAGQARPLQVVRHTEIERAGVRLPDAHRDRDPARAVRPPVARGT